MKPTPTTPEREAFLDACMASPLMEGEYGSPHQRLFVCDCQQKRAAAAGRATWEEQEAEIVAKGMILTEHEARIVFSGIPKEAREGKPSPFKWDGRAR